MWRMLWLSVFLLAGSGQDAPAVPAGDYGLGKNFTPEAVTTIPVPAVPKHDTVDNQRIAFVNSCSGVYSVIDSAALQDERRARIALVIGNADYARRALRNPVNDAEAITERLCSLGFQVMLLENAALEEMEQALLSFGKALWEKRPAPVGVFYFSGHALQKKGENYLLPVGQDNQAITGYPVSEIVKWMAGQSRDGLNVLFLDACRDNPWQETAPGLFVSQEVLGAPKGMTEIRSEQSKGTLVSYAAASGEVAYDGRGRHSPYTAALLAGLEKPGVGLSTLLNGVHDAVVNTTNGQQSPTYEAAMSGMFAFYPLRAGQTGTKEIRLTSLDDERPAAPQVRKAHYNRDDAYSRDRDTKHSRGNPLIFFIIIIGFLLWWLREE